MDLNELKNNMGLLTPNTRVERFSLQQAEGNLFVHRHFFDMASQTFWYTQDYYTVKNGVVMIVEEGGKLTKSGDSAFQLQSDCQLLGPYDPQNPPHQVVKSFGVQQLNEFIKSLP